jgi:tRNA/tmRNA/rRNA uracil-C5-methylase (TrmA/RlmC/RlmD family)
MTSPADQSMLELETGPVAAGGGCVARAPDGRVVFVRHSLPGERVRARVTSTTTSYLRADAIEILSPSPDRVPPPCPHAGPDHCGGCDYQHISLAAQRRLKADRIAEQLRHHTGTDRRVDVEAVAGDVEGLGWRTRVRLGVDREGNVGFRRHRSHDLEYVDSCPIACPEANASGAFEAQWTGAEELEITVAPDSGQALVAVVPARKTKLDLPRVTTGLVVKGKVRREPGALHTTVAGMRFRVSAGVFWQVHVGAATALVDAVRSALGAAPGDDVVDLYAGAGLFSVALAAAVGPKGSVLGVERDRRACVDAEHNGRDHPQLTIKKASISPNLIENGIGRPDLMVLDPAREGAGTAVMAAVAGHAATLRRLVYISCEPASFGRDARLLLDAGWTMSALRAFDIFPMTEHVELVATFDAPGRPPT